MEVYKFGLEETDKSRAGAGTWRLELNWAAYL